MRMPSFPDMWRRVVDFVRGIARVLEFVSALLAILVILGIGSSIAALVQGRWLWLATGAATAMISAVLLRIAFSKRHPRQAPYKLLKRETIYQYITRSSMIHTKRFSVKALVDGVGAFSDRFKWTGQGRCSLEPLVYGHVLVQPWSEQAWDFYGIRFPWVLHRGEVIDTGVSIELTDESGRALPVLTTGIYEPTDRLIMRVILPDELAPSEARFSEYMYYSDMMPLRSLPGRYDRVSHELAWEIERPRLGGKYAISWTFHSS